MTADAERSPAEQRGAPRPIKLQLVPIAAGILLAFLLLRLLGFAASASGVAAQLYVLPVIQFAALLAGGYLAGRLATVSGFMNGVAVAVVFIVVWAALNAIHEAQLVQEAGPAALPRMNMGGIVIGDLLNLIPAAFGGWLAERGRA
ncbi:MAG: hypothetical protein AVDCRST_MAG77-2117 [uncultured Chloroflexi bacterium]|uniref:Uncharacterized protein n=1 Tax=uncultured Chloroflexota bacterium TaxID=166587 RepID=A0A6J4IDU0_9CHLR|nr:MAG: hypothetical protein AVDCRST_MAG77-2117 [uncultured Chloroflexota bacterium]